MIYVADTHTNSIFCGYCIIDWIKLVVLIGSGRWEVLFLFFHDRDQSKTPLTIYKYS